jgi:hypothetical protein
MREHIHLLDDFPFPADKERIRRYVNGIALFLLIIIVALGLGYICPKIWHWFRVLYNTFCDNIYHLYSHPLH